MNENQMAQEMNNFLLFMSYRATWLFVQSLMLPVYFDKKAFFCGNQLGKTCLAAYQYVLRIFGSHPQPRLNFLYFECENGHEYTRPAPWPGFHHFKLNPGECFWSGKETKGLPVKTTFPQNMECPQCGADIKIHPRSTSIYRMCSENLPMEKEGSGADSAEIRNRTYPELKKWLPAHLIKKDITIRNPAMTVKDINSGQVFGTGPKAVQYPGRDIIFEFLSYNQDVQAGAGTQRLSIYLDEEPQYSFYEEQRSRLLAENGDLILGLTPANRSSWTFDEFFEEAEFCVRTQAIVDFYERTGETARAKRFERTSRKTGICVLQAATDDNPTLQKEAIESKITFADPDTEATRRYGIHRQATGRIFKDFAWKIHVINEEEHFANGFVPHFWSHFRGIDYHPRNPLACGCCSLSPTDELFIWNSKSLSPEKLTTYEIMEQFYHSCMDYKFRLHLIDPESETIKKDHISVLDDINRISVELRREGIGTGGYWQTWNTKGEHGRDQIKERLKNSRRVGTPFNNKVVEGNATRYLPTIWFFKSAHEAAESAAKWSYDNWADQQSVNTKDNKEQPQQRWSHFNMVLEAILKHPGFRFYKESRPQERDMGNQYFKTARAR